MEKRLVCKHFTGAINSECYYDHIVRIIVQDRSSHPEVFLRKGVLKICSQFTGEHPCRSVISIKLQSNGRKQSTFYKCFIKFRRSLTTPPLEKNKLKIEMSWKLKFSDFFLYWENPGQKQVEKYQCLKNWQHFRKTSLISRCQVPAASRFSWKQPIPFLIPCSKLPFPNFNTGKATHVESHDQTQHDLFCALWS